MVVDDSIIPGFKVEVDIKHNNKAKLKYNVKDVIKDSYDCSVDELENLIVELISNIRLIGNQDRVIERALHKIFSK
ncbi:hypothetical protein [Maledivibacter halophilus]|uniref:Uncharacterized protein n=1 Tax=Maledivibacter halophilus TaxID=36842 RepID=A0A1T5MQM5_9FIRM|nr:hypothetical protein [Maledivibacter halophilus]SKC90527.1 hypothetical protein SAMN02194393_05182 [Maledivibacter halophilus]